MTASPDAAGAETELQGYTLAAELWASPRSRVWRGRRPADGHPVIIKIINEAQPSPERLGRFRREYALTGRLAGAGVPEPLALESSGRGAMLVFTDTGATACDKLLAAEGAFTPLEATRIALGAARVLDRVHAQRLIHKDINPNNIVRNRAADTVELIDFELASELGQEDAAPSATGALEGTLAYLAPEQTGRMNRGVDYRADFYALGASLFELLTGQPPFTAEDPLALVHNHIAVAPPAVTDLAPGVPAQLDRIAARLLAKTPEARYQSARALFDDLVACHNALAAGEAVPAFTPGAHDIPDVLQIPEKLYGREAASAALEAGFERAAHGGREAALVTGEAGMGKSALVRELHKPVTARNGSFLAGKFDQLQRDRPYSALLQAFGDLVRQILAASEAQLTAWRHALQSALGPNGGVLIQLMPEIVEIIGEQPEPAPLNAQGERNRFNHTLLRFVGTIVAPERPLVLFLDDLQWADSASIGLLRTLLLDPELGYLYVVGAYRPGEVDDGHPLARLIADLRQSEAGPVECDLAGLAEADVAQLVADTINTTPAECAGLAREAYTKTLGNPFFLERLLARWAADGLLWPDRDAGRWRWDEAGVAASGLADNVVALMADKLHSLPESTQQTLALAAVLGGQVDLANLAIVARLAPPDVLSQLWPAVEADLIRPMDDDYKYIGEIGHSGHAWLRFRHDRIQQAALAQLDPEAYRQAQLAAGRLLLAEMADPQTDERLFDALGHLNAVADRLPAADERDQLIRLNLVAGERAQRAAAYGPADRFLEAGLGLLGARGWATAPELAHSLTQRSAETAFMLGDMARMRERTETILAHVPAVARSSAAWELRIQAHVLQGDPDAGLREGLTALARLGVKVPARPGKAATLADLVRTRRRLKGVDLQAQAERGEPAEPSHRAIMRLIAALIAPAYIARPNLFPLLVMRQVRLSIQLGNHPSSAYAFATYGLLLMALGRPVGEADPFARLAQTLLGRLNAERYRCATNFVVCFFIDAWQEDLATVTERLVTVQEEGLRSGDLQFAAYAAHCHGYIVINRSVPLSQIEAHQAQDLRLIQKLGQQASENILRPSMQIAHHLYYPLAEPTRLQGPHIVETTDFEAFNQQANHNALLSVIHTKTLCAYHYGGLAELGPWLRQMRRHVANGRGSPSFARGYAVYVAVAAAHASAGQGAADRRVRRELRSGLKRLDKLLGNVANPDCFRPFVELARGEVRRLEGRFPAALAAFEAAIAGAKEKGYHHEAGLARERAAKLQEARGLGWLAASYIVDALGEYAHWEAHGKLAHLRRRYPNLVAGSRAGAGSGTAGHQGSISTSVSTERDPDLDLEAVVRAAQTISQEIRPAQLAEILMTVVGQAAGATHGVLLLGDREDRLRTQAILDSDRDPSVTVLVDQPDSAPPPGDVVPMAALRYALRRHELVAVDEPTKDRSYSADAYIDSYRPGSILCLPLVNQGRLTGVLYVEHRHAAGAFPASRTTILGLLSAQMAVSLENAQLYEAMEDKVAQRTQELEAEKAETERAHRVIQDSLETARRMQRAALPQQRAGELGLADLAIWWQPRDQVGGDFYRLARHADGRHVAIVLMDCTGHGVPGALISFVASAAADQALAAAPSWEPRELLGELDRRVRAQLHGQAAPPSAAELRAMAADATISDDGVEAGIAVIDTRSGALAFAGAGIHLFRHDGEGVTTERGARLGLGYRTAQPPAEVPVARHSGGAGTAFTMATDGILEQTGGAKGLQLGRKRFARLLEENDPAEALADQVAHIQSGFARWQGDQPQRDDVTLIAFRL